ncbi:MAG: hypothetical protein JST23_10190 [Bacteroidetes bacterium]|nr:hypothetical protein [Bacteroidota bacterium]
MKKIIPFLFVFFLSFVKISKAQTADSIVNHLLAINENSYIGLPLDSIIAHLPSGYTEMKILDLRNTARSLCIKYPNKVWIELHVRQFIHINPFSANKFWDLNAFKLEKLYKTTIYKNNNCYRNCDLREPQ